jgi:diguanylate cyclase (GGDEF)-like protein/PAS domain S-box-containing protein
MIDMRDYPPAAKAVWIVFALVGAAVIVWSAAGLRMLSQDLLLQCAVGTLCAVIASFFPIKQPGTTDAFSASDLFLFLILAIAGPAAAVVATAIESFAGAMRISKRWTSRLGTPAFCALAMALAGLALAHARTWLGDTGPGTAEATLGGLLIAAGVYFFVHSFLIDAVFRLKARKPVDLADWFKNSYWHGVMLCVAAVLAGLLYLSVERLGIAALLVGAPLVLLLSSSLHYYFGTVEAGVLRLKTSEEHLKQLAASEEKFHKAFDKAAIGLALVDEDLNVVQVNEAFATITGELTGRAVARSVKQYLSVDSWRKFNEEYAYWRADPVKPFTQELRIECAQPRECWVHATVSVFETDTQGKRSLILQINDVTARRQSEGKLQFLAFHDPLTGLKNRPFLLEALQNAIALASRDDHFQYAVVMLDFNRFKMINDSLGHAAGDELLVKVADRLHKNVREHDVVARFGGDEFAILLQRFGQDSDALELTQRLAHSIAEPLTIAGMETSVTASFGITFGRFGYTRSDDALRDADLAMYEAKRAGTGQTVVFSGAMHEKVSRSLRVENDLRLALRHNQFALALQPIWNFKRNERVGFEALVRWKHPIEGWQLPGEFIPIAEETGLIDGIGQWVARETIQTLAAMTQRTALGGKLPVAAINVSPRQLAGGMFAAWLINQVDAAGISPAQLVIELTEQALADAKSYILEELRSLRTAGFSVALDDFGTGYSSLSHLQNVPANIIKLDRVFTQRLTQQTRDRDIAAAIVALAHSLGMTVCAEGVETAEQFDAVRALGCESAQGFYIGQPELNPSAALSTALAKPDLPVNVAAVPAPSLLQ